MTSWEQKRMMTQRRGFLLQHYGIPHRAYPEVCSFSREMFPFYELPRVSETVWEHARVATQWSVSVSTSRSVPNPVMDNDPLVFFGHMADANWSEYNQVDVCPQPAVGIVSRCIGQVTSVSRARRHKDPPLDSTGIHRDPFEPPLFPGFPSATHRSVRNIEKPLCGQFSSWERIKAVTRLKPPHDCDRRTTNDRLKQSSGHGTDWVVNLSWPSYFLGNLGSAAAGLEQDAWRIDEQSPRARKQTNLPFSIFPNEAWYEFPDWTVGRDEYEFNQFRAFEMYEPNAAASARPTYTGAALRIHGILYDYQYSDDPYLRVRDLARFSVLARQFDVYDRDRICGSAFATNTLAEVEIYRRPQVRVRGKRLLCRLSNQLFWTSYIFDNRYGPVCYDWPDHDRFDLTNLHQGDERPMERWMEESVVKPVVRDKARPAPSQRIVVYEAEGAVVRVTRRRSPEEAELHREYITPYRNWVGVYPLLAELPPENLPQVRE